jgi:hypothetical protein
MRLSEFNSGIKDLRELFSEPELNEFYLCDIENFDLPYQNLSLYENTRIPDEWLPEQGFYRDRI